MKSSGYQLCGRRNKSLHGGRDQHYCENVPHWWKSDSKYYDGGDITGIKALIIQFRKRFLIKVLSICRSCNPSRNYSVSLNGESSVHAKPVNNWENK
jgi:hypothetical protein